MPRTEKACLEYIKATVNINFEQDHVACLYCPLLETQPRNMCRRSGEYIVDIRTIGYYCPLNFEEGANYGSN